MINFKTSDASIEQVRRIEVVIQKAAHAALVKQSDKFSPLSTGFNIGQQVTKAA